jgi:hypothetical protein
MVAAYLSVARPERNHGSSEELTYFVVLIIRVDELQVITVLGRAGRLRGRQSQQEGYKQEQGGHEDPVGRRRRRRRMYYCGGPYKKWSAEREISTSMRGGVGRACTNSVALSFVQSG